MLAAFNREVEKKREENAERYQQQDRQWQEQKELFSQLIGGVHDVGLQLNTMSGAVCKLVEHELRK